MRGVIVAVGLPFSNDSKRRRLSRIEGDRPHHGLFLKHPQPIEIPGYSLLNYRARRRKASAVGADTALGIDGSDPLEFAVLTYFGREWLMPKFY